MRFSRRQSAAGRADISPASNFRIKIKERFQAGPQLLLNFIFAAFEHVHCDVRRASILQLYGRFAYFHDFIGGQQSHAVHQRQICHSPLL
jgi:hypothetical protein